jgi:hypothetical protein
MAILLLLLIAASVCNRDRNRTVLCRRAFAGVHANALRISETGEEMPERIRWKGTLAAMAAGGAIGVVLAPAVAPAFARIARPAMKGALRVGLIAYRRGREAAAELMETVEDVAAEVKAETGPSDEAPTVLKTARR